ncbi:MAG: ketopantoate reductase C-terminal domain-containing protein, partial [Candidatus Margulisiibacteriota bacterium]
QDIHFWRKSQTEISYLSEVVLSLAKKQGIKVPVTEAIIAAVHNLQEQNKLEPARQPSNNVGIAADDRANLVKSLKE